MGVSTGALQRHTRDHLPDRLKQAHEAEEKGEALAIAQQLKEINEATREILTEARGQGQHETALRAVDRIQRQLSLQLTIIKQAELEKRLEALEAALNGK